MDHHWCTTDHAPWLTPGAGPTCTLPTTPSRFLGWSGGQVAREDFEHVDIVHLGTRQEAGRINAAAARVFPKFCHATGDLDFEHESFWDQWTNACLEHRQTEVCDVLRGRRSVSKALASQLLKAEAFGSATAGVVKRTWSDCGLRTY